MDKDIKILMIAAVLLLAIGFLSFSYTGNFVSKRTRGYETRELTKIWISNDGENYIDEGILDLKFGGRVYFKVETGFPFGTDALVKFYWYPDKESGIFREEIYKSGTYMPGCGKPSCRGGLTKEFKYLTIGLEKGLNCAVFKDRGFEEEIKVCFNLI